MQLYPFIFWPVAAGIDVLFDKRFPRDPNKTYTPEEIQAYTRLYFLSMTGINVLYYAFSKDARGALVAQAGYMAGVEDTLYFVIKKQPVPTNLEYLPTYMNTRGKLLSNTVFSAIAAALL